jgi:hypothetical protein
MALQRSGRKIVSVKKTDTPALLREV